MSRSRKKRKMNQTYWVFCEGKTEEAYVSFLRSHYSVPTIRIKAKVKGNSISRNYIDRYLKGEFTAKGDQLYLLYDIDAPKMLHRLQTIRGCTMLLNNPCIEFWFLLYYQSHNSACKESFCLKELNNRNRQYKKGVIDSKLEEKLITKMDKACERAKALQGHENPSSSLYIFIEALKRNQK